jgi:hypothetical protein
VERAAGEGIRLVQMALETGAVGDQVTEGVELVVEAGDLPVLIQALADDRADPAAVESVWQTLTADGILEPVLHAAKPDLGSVAALVERAGADRVERLLDLMLEAEDGGVRRLVLERVVSFGAPGTVAIRHRLEQVPPAGQRLLLGGLAECGRLPAELEVREFASAPEPMVRLEAFRLMLRHPTVRDEAIYLGLTDVDDRVVRLVVDAGMEGIPRQSLSRLMLLLSNPRRSPDLQARAVPILAQFDGPSVRQWLYDGMVMRRGWFRRTKLAPKSPLVVAKLRVIVARWPDAPDTRRLIRLAERSGDAELVAACRPAEGP